MSGYRVIEVVRPVLSYGPPKVPIVDRALIYGRVAAGTDHPPPAPERADEKKPVILASTVRRMVEMRERGLSLGAIAKACGCSHRSVGRHTQHVTPPEDGWGDGSRPGRVNLAVAQRMRRAGFTLREIGDNFGVAETTIHIALHGRRHRLLGAVRRVNRLVQHVARVSGVPIADLRAPRRGVGKKGAASVSKARCILFWVIHQSQAPIGYEIIGNRLGGFHGTTVGDGARRTERAISALGLAVPLVPSRLVRTLWNTRWPVEPGRRQR